MKPTQKPLSAHFSSGPTKKPTGWTLSSLGDAALGRSHRAKDPKAKISSAIVRMHQMLGLPDEYRLGIVPASDTGAVEMAMWSVLGARGVDILAWESFGKTWVGDATKQLQLEDCRIMEADWGALPDLSQVDFSRDVLFTYNGTTSGVRVPDTDWIPANRTGLTIADATSACFAMEMDFSKLDITTFSWQKSLGGEGGFGVIILSPRAVERLESYSPPRPLPKIFQLTKAGKLIEGIFRGDTINTPSLLCIEDLHVALDWADRLGGLEALIARSTANLEVVQAFVAESDWCGFLCAEDAHLSSTSICLKITHPDILAADSETQTAFAKNIVNLLADEQVAFDIGAYRNAPAGLRLWGGPTVEPDDMRALMPWLDWAFSQTRLQMGI
ncbi:MAG: phosphoserine transaminase [Candidatus Puniceispirillaceae bacterium]